MDNTIEFSSKPMSKLKRRPPVYANWAIDLNDGDPVTPDPVKGLWRQLVRIVATTVPESGAKKLSCRRANPEYPWRVFMVYTCCRIELWGWRPVKNSSLLSSNLVSLRLCQSAQKISFMVELFDPFGVVDWTDPCIVHIRIGECEEQHFVRKCTKMVNDDIPSDILMSYGNDVQRRIQLGVREALDDS